MLFKTQLPSIFVRLAVFAILAQSPSWTIAQQVPSFLTTQDGCKFPSKLSASTPQSVLDAIKQQKYNWDGACAEGLISGWGKLTSSLTGVSTVTEGYHLSGELIGYSKLTIKMEDKTEVQWAFSDGIRTVSFGEIGLIGNESLLANVIGSMPTRSFLVPDSWKKPGVGLLPRTAHLVSGGRQFMLWASPCWMVRNDFPECGGAFSSSFFVHYFTVHKQDDPAGAAAAKEVFCPAPRDVNSCNAVLEVVLSPLVEETESIIRNGWRNIERVGPGMVQAIQRKK